MVEIGVSMAVAASRWARVAGIVVASPIRNGARCSTHRRDARDERNRAKARTAYENARYRTRLGRVLGKVLYHLCG
jgi:hypothetical protein